MTTFKMHADGRIQTIKPATISITFAGRQYQAEEQTVTDGMRRLTGIERQFIITGARGAMYLLQVNGTHGRAISHTGQRTIKGPVQFS